MLRVVDFAEGEFAAFEFERHGIAAADEGEVEEMGEVHAGSSLPLVSSARGRSASPDEEGDGSERHRGADGVHAGDAGAHQERDAGGQEAAERGGEGEGAAAALGAVLFRQPERVDGEIGAADAEEEEAGHEPRQGVAAEIEDVAEAERDADEHQDEEEGERAAASDAGGQGGNQEAAQDGAGGEQHDGPGGELRGVGGGEAFAGGEVGDGRRHVDRPGPEPDHGDEEQRRVAEGAAAVLGGEEGEEGERARSRGDRERRRGVPSARARARRSG